MDYAKRFDVISQLRGTKGNLACLMRPGCAFVDIRAVDTSLTPDQLKCNELEIITRQVAQNVYGTFIRATYGYKLDVAKRVFFGQYVPYSGPNDIFCATHFSQFGLAEINANHQINTLSTPDITINKGVVGYVSISQARLRGVEFYSKVGDRHNNKIACFDTDLKDCFYTFVHVPTYANEDSLIRTHANIISTLARFGVSQATALIRVKNLIISDDDDLEAGNVADDESPSFRTCFMKNPEDAMEKLRLAFKSIILNA